MAEHAVSLLVLRAVEQRLGTFGKDGSGSHPIHPYAVLPYRQRMRPGEIGHACLRRRISALQSRGYNPEDRSDVNDGALPSCDHPGRHGAGAEEDPIEIDADNLVPVCIREFMNGNTVLAYIDPGVV